MCLFRLSCGVYVAIVKRTARPLKVKPVQHIPPVLRSRFRINDERPRACPYIGLSLANFLGFLSFFSARARAFLFLSASLCFSGSAYGIKIALLRSDQRRGLEYFSRKKYNIPVKNRWLQVLDTCNYWGQAGSVRLTFFYSTPQIQILQAFLDRVGHATNPVISRGLRNFGVDKKG